MRYVLFLFALVCSLSVVSRGQTARTSVRLTPANVNDQRRSFTITAERVRDKEIGPCLRFLMAVKAKAGDAPLSPRRSTELAISNGKEFVSSCEVKPSEQRSEVSYSFLVAAKYTEKSTFALDELTSAPGDPESGIHSWFYLQDFVEQPLPQGNAALPALAKECKGALVATLLEIGGPHLGPPGASDYSSRWKVEKTLRGTYAGVVCLTFRVQSIPIERRERPPTVGKKYILISYEANANQVAAILDANEKNLRKVQDLLGP